MQTRKSNVISCSRRTDIPHLYAGWLWERLSEGSVEWTAPRGSLRSVSLRPEYVHSIVFWSKNYGPFLRTERLLDRIRELNPFFHMTMTGLGGTVHESRIPRWQEAAAQLEELAERFGPERLDWRFDPVLHWREGDETRTNLEIFTQIGSRLAAAGIVRCTFSFAQQYVKVGRRCRESGVELAWPDDAEKLELAERLAAAAAELGIGLYSCSSSLLAGVPGIQAAQCVNGGLLSSLRGDGAGASLAKDSSQRDECGCTRSIDIGSYQQTCVRPACVYCYAG